MSLDAGHLRHTGEALVHVYLQRGPSVGRMRTVRWQVVGIDVEDGKHCREEYGWGQDKQAALDEAERLRGEADPAYDEVIVEEQIVTYEEVTHAK